MNIILHLKKESQVAKRSRSFLLEPELLLSTQYAAQKYNIKLKFWGAPKGSESEKNKEANEVLVKLLDNCIWMNVHFVPPKLDILEVIYKYR